MYRDSKGAPDQAGTEAPTPRRASRHRFSPGRVTSVFTLARAKDLAESIAFQAQSEIDPQDDYTTYIERGAAQFEEVEALIRIAGYGAQMGQQKEAERWLIQAYELAQATGPLPGTTDHHGLVAYQTASALVDIGHHQKAFEIIRQKGRNEFIYSFLGDLEAALRKAPLKTAEDRQGLQRMLYHLIVDDKQG